MPKKIIRKKITGQPKIASYSRDGYIGADLLGKGDKAIFKARSGYRLAPFMKERNKVVRSGKVGAIRAQARKIKRNI